jgi:hypothetical protein
MIEFALHWLSDNRAAIHILLHILVPLIAAYLYGLFTSKSLQILSFKIVFLLLIATMAVDVDHLLAKPIYSPGRCSIWFHPLHTFWPMVIYGLMMVAPICLKLAKGRVSKAGLIVGILGAGLTIHMALDWSDCLWMKACTSATVIALLL